MILSRFRVFSIPAFRPATIKTKRRQSQRFSSTLSCFLLFATTVQFSKKKNSVHGMAGQTGALLVELRFLNKSCLKSASLSPFQPLLQCRVAGFTSLFHIQSSKDILPAPSAWINRISGRRGAWLVRFYMPLCQCVAVMSFYSRPISCSHNANDGVGCYDNYGFSNNNTPLHSHAHPMILYLELCNLKTAAHLHTGKIVN